MRDAAIWIADELAREKLVGYTPTNMDTIESILYQLGQHTRLPQDDDRNASEHVDLSSLSFRERALLRSKGKSVKSNFAQKKSERGWKLSLEKDDLISIDAINLIELASSRMT